MLTSMAFLSMSIQMKRYEVFPEKYMVINVLSSMLKGDEVFLTLDLVKPYKVDGTTHCSVEEIFLKT